ncbi:MAG: DotA/TraY family protein [Gallionella sp.]|jgi:conjugal transfer/type IV secretion protein DotA/TraY|nr:DotA/TraY family protein [Gallionella sp.]MCK9353199.1 DotA/TraY family protein [Gallionella sp.]
MDPQNAQTYIPQASDSAVDLLHQVFGTSIEHWVPGLQPLPPAMASAASALAAMFGWFNSGVLIFGTVILAWITIFGITNTANDGVALGKKWSTFYTPLRTLTASACLIPSTSGYSLIQLLIMKFIILWGSGFASVGWGVYVERAVVGNATNTVMQSVVDDSKFDMLAADAIRMQVCAYAAGKAAEIVFPDQKPFAAKFKETPRTQSGDLVKTMTTVSYSSPSWGGSDEICGQMQIVSNFSAPGHTNDQGAADVAAKLANQITVTQYKFVSGLFGPSGVKPISDQIISAVEGNQPVSAASIRTQITQLRQRMLDELRITVHAGIAVDNATLLTKLTAQGWVSAGSLYMEIARLKDFVRRSTKVNSSFVPGAGLDHLLTPGQVNTALQTAMFPYNAVAGNALTRALSTPENHVKPPLPSLPTFKAEDFMDGGSSIKSFFSSTFAGWADDIVGLVVYSLNPNSEEDLIWQIKDLGDNIAGYSEAALVAGAIMKGGLEGLQEAAKTGSQESVLGTNISAVGAFVVGAIAGVKGLFFNLFALMSQGLYALLYLGYFLSIWIPLVPYFIFTIGVIAWLVQCVESLIASALWMVMHLTPEGNDSFIGGQQQGYLLLMSLFTRPALMLLGLVATFTLLNPAIGFINSGFMLMFRGMQADSITGLLSVAGFILAYGVVLFSAIMLLFSLPQTLPDRILRWIGAGIGDLGEQSTAHRIEQIGSNQGRTAMVVTSGALRASTGSGKDSVRRSLGAARDQADSSAASREHAPEGHTPSSLTIGPGSSGVE